MIPALRWLNLGNKPCSYALIIAIFIEENYAYEHKLVQLLYSEHFVARYVSQREIN